MNWELIFTPIQATSVGIRTLYPDCGGGNYSNAASTSTNQLCNRRLTQPLPARLHVGGDTVQLSLKLFSGFRHELMILSYYLGLRLCCLNL